MYRLRALRISAVLVFLALLAPGLNAQEKRPLTLDDYPEWSRITEVELSQDGRWMAYALQPNEGDATFFVESLDGGATHEAMNGGDAAFSSDGRWVAFLTTPPEEEAEKLREDRKPVPRTLHLIDLRSGDATEEAGVRAFSFSENAAYLAIHRDRSDREAEHEGSDLILRDLATGTLMNFGNVSQFAFDEDGSHLAYLVDAAAMAGNGLYLVDPSDGRVRALDTGARRYDDLTWNETGDALAVLSGETPEGMTERDNVLLVTRGVGGAPSTTVWDPEGAAGFPAGFVLSEDASTRWTEDGERVVIGIKEQEEEFDEDEDGPNVDVWHWADDRVQSVQMIQEGGDRRFTYTSVYNVDDGRFVRLADDDMRRVTVTEGQWAVGRRDVAYRGDVDEAGGRADFVRIDMDTGERTDIAPAVRRSMGISPDGGWWLYVTSEEVHAVELASLAHTNITAETGIDFINREFDLINEAPAHGVGGWTGDDSVLLYDRWDIWEVPLDGGEASAVTGGAGDAEQIRYRVQRLDPEADWVDPDDLTLSAYGEWTKQSGYMRARPGQAPEPLLFGDEMIGGVRKAADADRVILTRQTFEQFPDYWVSNTDFDDPRQVTDANPQIDEFLWGRRVLVNYTDDRGNELQATLALPANYAEGERYPLVVYFYEKMSQRHHQFSMPVYDDRPHMSTYASNGYLVLMPDIVYDDGYPGSSALDDVTAATERVVELGYADPDRLGLQGHSWGGYQSSFIVTQTDLFAAVVTGAPLTNLMSMNNILYKRSGNVNGPILQWSQGRMGDQPWDDMERWMSQSPVHQAPNISTPFLILHGTEDGAVDWNQALEFYTAARRLGKEVILLSYPGEPHHLQEEANQKDFQVRMMQYFDHHLKGLPAPSWMTEGVPHLEKGKEKPKIIS